MESKKSDFFELIKDFRDDYTQYLKQALKEGLKEIRKAKEMGCYMGNYYDFPHLSFNKNGLPNFSSSIGIGPIEYRSCFNSHIGNPIVNEDELASFEDLVAFVRSHEALRTRFGSHMDRNAYNGLGGKLEKITILSGAEDCIERYIYSFGNFEYDEERAIKAVAPTVAYIFDRELNVDIKIPILFLKFQFDEYQLADNVYIEKISELHHKSRYRVRSYNASTHQHVTYSATHALVLKEYYVPNSEKMYDFDILSQIRAYPTELIDQFFGALRISSSVDTGYAQIYAVAKGWEAHCTADLPYVQGVTTRSYPSWFEDYYWNTEEVPTISDETMNCTKLIFNQILSSKENSIGLALKRLNRCLVRDNEEDAVLDATIALEALLSDDGNQEMTHKLALRIGALSKLDKILKINPVQAFQNVKNIYGYRSAIVHGSKNLEKKRIIKIDENNNVAVYALAIDYLRLVLRLLLDNEKYRSPKAIDEDLLLGLESDA